MIRADYKDRPRTCETALAATCKGILWGVAALYCVWALRVCVLLWGVQS